MQALGRFSLQSCHDIGWIQRHRRRPSQLHGAWQCFSGKTMAGGSHPAYFSLYPNMHVLSKLSPPFSTCFMSHALRLAA